jgi:predicted transcriptional regulator
MKKLFYVFLLFLFQKTLINAQSWGDYTLIARQGQTTVNLFNLNNTVYKSWTGLPGGTGYSSYMLPNGELLRSVTVSGASLTGGGVHGRVQKVSWSGAILWDYTLNTSSPKTILHHDICPLPNGNVLVIQYEETTAAMRAAVGYTGSQTLWTENILELQPSGTNGANIVWQWKLWDHLVQNVNTGLSNYGIPSQNPQLLDINYNSNSRKDWVHANGLDYNANKDQIIFSSHYLNEAYVIDHSTTTTQAASHSGGNGGKGGDFLYRFGNPAAYGYSGVTFDVIHDSHWIPEDCPNAGQMVAFHNNGGGSNSAVEFWQPPVSGFNFTYSAGTAYGPAALSNHIVTNGKSTNMSNSQQLPNGNHLICLATIGSVYEINSSNSVVWSYSTGGTTPQARRYSACFINGNPTGTITPTATTVCTNGATTLNFAPSATGNYTYAWSASNGGFSSSTQNPTVNPTQTTTYTLNITSGTGASACTGTVQTTITVSPPPSANAGADVTINNGQSTSLTASGGTTYAWSNGQSGASINVSPTATTTYTVTVTNSAGCSATDAVVVYVNAQPVSAVATATPSTVCSGTPTTLNVTGSGGSGSYTYVWSSVPTGFSSSLKNPTISPTQTTTYSVVVTSGGQSTTASVGVNVNPLPLANAGNDVTILYGQSTTLTANGGSTYAWSNGQSGASITVSPLQTTTYTVSVTDANGCVATDAVVVNITFPVVTATTTASPSTVCVGESMQLQCTPLGGNGNYTFNWSSSNGTFSSSLQNPTVTPVSSTTYTVSVTSASGSTTSQIFVGVNTLPSANAGQDVTIVQGQNTILTASGGANYAWSNGQFGATINVSPSQTTNYTVTVTDGNGCKAVDNVLVNVVSVLQGNITTTKNIICAGANTQLNAVANGGTGVYTYNWSGNGFSSSLQNPTITPSQTTTYTVTITSGTQTTTSSVVITVNPLPTANAGSDITVTQGNTATLTASGGTTYAWSSGQSGATITVTPSQTTNYTVTVTNANGCKATDVVTVFVNIPPPLVVSATATASTICEGKSTSLNAIANGGNNTYTYNWSSQPNGLVATTASVNVNPLQTTVYTVTVSSGNTTSTASVTVTVNPLPVAIINAPGSITIGQNATLTASGGSTYLWSNNEATAVINVTPTTTTTYTVTVTNTNGCSSVAQTTLAVTGVPLSATATATNPNICVGNSTQLNVLVSGEVGNSTFAWSSSVGNFTATTQNPIVSPTQTTTYTVTITNNNKQVTASTSVTVNPLPTANAGNQVAILIGETATLTASGGTIYLWNTGETTATIQVKPTKTTVYTVTVTNNNGCSASDQVVVSVNQPLTVTIKSTVATICAGDSSQISAIATGGTGNTYTYIWSSQPIGFSANTAVVKVTPIQNTTYTVTVNDGTYQTISQIDIIALALPNAPTVTVKKDTLYSSAAVGNQWYWNGKIIPNATGNKLYVDKTGNYQVKITDSNGCQSKLSTIIYYQQVGTQEIVEKSTIIVTPNPTTGRLNVTSSNFSQNYKVEIFTIEGKKVFAAENVTTIDISHQIDGLYFVKITDNNTKRQFLNKIVLNR